MRINVFRLGVVIFWAVSFISIDNEIVGDLGCWASTYWAASTVWNVIAWLALPHSMCRTPNSNFGFRVYIINFRIVVSASMHSLRFYNPLGSCELSWHGIFSQNYILGWKETKIIWMICYEFGRKLLISRYCRLATKVVHWATSREAAPESCLSVW